MFPTANSTIIRNEDGEVLGWDNPVYDYDDGSHYADDYLSREEPRDYEEPDVWGDQEACEEQGYHRESGNSVAGRNDVWQCTACGGLYPRED